MHVLIAAIGSSGDVLPLIAIGGELQRRGHRVTMAAPAPFGPMAARAGIGFEALGTERDYAAAFADPALWSSRRGVRTLFAAVAAAIPPTFAFVMRRHRRGRTIVLASSLALGARVAVGVRRGPYIVVHLQPVLMQSRHEAPRLPGLFSLGWLPAELKWRLQIGADRYVIDPALLPALNAFRAEIGQDPVRRLRHWWNARGRVLLLYPPWFAAFQPDWPKNARQVGFPCADMVGAPDEGPEALAAFLDAGPKPVAVTFGTGMLHGEAMYRAAIAACAALGLRCVVSCPHPLEIPPEGRGQVFVLRYAPFSVLLPRCRAIIHHGGIGTVAQAFAAAIPQLIVPLAFDQFDNAERVKRLGCGLVLRREAFGARIAARRLRGLLASTRVSEACAGVAQRCVGADAIGRVCEEVEAVFAESRALRGGGDR
ncbi:glycosyltransferase [Hansschlegelia beijingensis]|uniref:UDP:flavonoid glycosyltransferase YjiC (YdhE family) n=1 Tax=Hansschlegelia beijingensis TaxID=1133344 RepID=A0A7W6GEI2_9HYPH|nr:nucleotide disphospho-sugar-binding domain-containing protein [Hansschlegelia beijingensis]MBB3972063.1 UDP:flavonoid glycosyltransferase YjiC (YdhE family) [Hansschlegelia beijingensis]